MRKAIAFVFIITLFFTPLLPETFLNYSNSFFGVYGRESSVMGKIDGSAFEVWVYPYKVFHDFRFNVYERGMKEEPFSKLSYYKISENFVKRVYVNESWKIEEKIFASYNNPIVYIIYKISNLNPVEIEFNFKPDLSPMWPASLGGKFSWWNDKGFFVLGEAKWKNFGFIGFPKGIKEGKLPAHKLPGGKLKYKVSFDKGEHTIVIPVSAGNGKYEVLEKQFLDFKNRWKDELERRIDILNKFKSEHLHIKSSDPILDFGINNSVIRLNSAFVKNPYLGEGLIAGYGLSGEGERPGFAWFFGGDGVINSLAILDYGGFEGVKKEIEFLFKYQRKDGKIPHEISQGAGFVNWFKDYGFPYFHGDTTLYFTVLLGEYLKYSGDLDLLKKYKDKIKLLKKWIERCDKNGDGIVETKYAGTGASETGPLRREKIETDILLAGLSVKAWDELKFIFEEILEKEGYYKAKSFFEKAKSSFETMFWNEKNNYYDYAVKKRGRLDVITVWPSIPMRFSVVEKSRGELASKKIASPFISTDWGVRFLSSESKYYAPLSYNNGAVWPFLTGFASLALYRYGNPYHGYSLLAQNLNIIKDFDYSYATELLSGNSYIPLNQSVNNQIWSYGTTLSAFVEGMLGFSPDAVKRLINFTPKIPLSLKLLKVKNLKVGKGIVDFSYVFKNNEIVFDYNFKNLKGFRVKITPQIFSKNYERLENCKEIENGGRINSDDFKCSLRYEIFNYAYPFVEDKKLPGDSSGNPIINNFVVNKNGFKISLWGIGKEKVKIISDRDFTCRNMKKIGNLIVIDLGNSWKLKRIYCDFY